MDRTKDQRTHHPVVSLSCALALAFSGCTEDFDAPFAGAGTTGGAGHDAGDTGGAGGISGAGGEAGTGGATGGSAGEAGGTGGGTGGSAGEVGGAGGATGGSAGDAGGAGGATGGSAGEAGGAGGATGGSAGEAGGTGGGTGGSGGTVGETGRVYYSPPNSADLFVYDPNTNAWSEKDPSPLDTHAMTAHGGFLYAKSAHNNVALYRYTPGTDSWVTVSHAPSGSSIPAHLVASETHVYYFANDKDVHRYNPSADSWATAVAMPLDRGQLDSFEYADGHVYHLSASSRTLRRYDVSSDTWSASLATFPSTTYGIQDLQRVDGLLYAVSGLADAHVYDPVTQAIDVEWLAPAQVMSYDANDGLAYVWSGVGGGGSTFGRCDLANQSFTELSPPPSAIYGHAWAYIP